MNRTTKTGYTDWRGELLKNDNIHFIVENDTIIVKGKFKTGKELLSHIFFLLKERRKLEPNFGK